MFQPYVYMGMCPGSERHLRLVFVCKQMLALEGGSTLHTAHGMAGPCSEKDGRARVCHCAHFCKVPSSLECAFNI